MGDSTVRVCQWFESDSKLNSNLSGYAFRNSRHELEPFILVFSSQHRYITNPWKYLESPHPDQNCHIQIYNGTYLDIQVYTGIYQYVFGHFFGSIWKCIKVYWSTSRYIPKPNCPNKFIYGLLQQAATAVAAASMAAIAAAAREVAELGKDLLSSHVTPMQ
jgi:hypothetical protein